MRGFGTPTSLWKLGRVDARARQGSSHAARDERADGGKAEVRESRHRANPAAGQLPKRHDPDLHVPEPFDIREKRPTGITVASDTGAVR